LKLLIKNKRILDPGCWIQDAGCWIQDAGYMIEKNPKS
jgi:hypothetical protein